MISIAKTIFDIDFSSPRFDVPKTRKFATGGVQKRENKTRRLGMIVTSFQDFKLLGKQICSTFSYFLTSKVPLYHFLANLLAHNKKTAAWLAQLVGHQSAVREVEGSSPRPDQHSGS